MTTIQPNLAVNAAITASTGTTSASPSEASVAQGLKALAAKSPTLYRSVLAHIKNQAPAQSEHASMTGGHAYSVADGNGSGSSPAEGQFRLRFFPDSEVVDPHSSGTANSGSTSVQQWKLSPQGGTGSTASQATQIQSGQTQSGQTQSGQTQSGQTQTSQAASNLTNAQKMLANSMSGLVIFDRNGSISKDFMSQLSGQKQVVRPSTSAAVPTQAVVTGSAKAVDVSA